jgi:hypothetical protein
MEEIAYPSWRFYRPPPRNVIKDLGAGLTCCQLVEFRGEVKGNGDHGDAEEEDDGRDGAYH